MMLTVSSLPKQTHKIVRRLTVLGLALLSVMPLFSQNFFLPLNSLSQLRMEREALPTQPGIHYSFKPVLTQGTDLTDIDGLGLDSTKYYYWITAKLFSEHLIELRKPNLKLNIDPLFDFAVGSQFTSTAGESHSLYTNMRGFSLSAKIGNRVYVHTDFRENQARFPDYIRRFVDSLGVAPGNGRVKDFKTDAYDFSMANGYVGIRAAEWLSINFGHSKQFIGDGHRSLLLSDNAYSYPFASYILTFGGKKQFQYRYNIALMQNLERLPIGDTPESRFKRKVMSYSFLSFKPTRSLEIGLYESVIWKAYDDTTGTEPFNFTALNPIPLINTAVYDFDDAAANPLIGLNLAWQPVDKLRLYGQLMLDDINTQKYGYQAGVKVFKILGRIDLRAEYNKVSAGAYAAENPLMGYTNVNQPLAHPFGAGFEALNATLDYYYKGWLASVNLMAAKFNPSGRDPLISDRTKTVYSLEHVASQQLKLAYVFNPSTNMQVYFSVTNRLEKGTFEARTEQFWYFGIRTYLQNIYTDF